MLTDLFVILHFLTAPAETLIFNQNVIARIMTFVLTNYARIFGLVSRQVLVDRCEVVLHIIVREKDISSLLKGYNQVAEERQNLNDDFQVELFSFERYFVVQEKHAYQLRNVRYDVTFEIADSKVPSIECLCSSISILDPSKEMASPPIDSKHFDLLKSLFCKRNSLLLQLLNFLFVFLQKGGEDFQVEDYHSSHQG